MGDSNSTKHSAQTTGIFGDRAARLTPPASRREGSSLAVHAGSGQWNAGEAGLLVCGDWAPVREFSNAPTMPPEKLYGDLLGTIDQADLAIVNLECPLGKGTPLTKDGPCFCAPAESADVLAAVGFGVASLANNHIFDQGPEGLEVTLEACRHAGLATVGAGKDLASAMKPLFMDVSGFRMGIVALADTEEGMADRGGGGAAPIEDIHVLDCCRQARRECDFLLVIPHGGKEYTPFPPPYWYDRLVAIADAGADAVVGHHPHVPQGMVYLERSSRQPVPLVFSTGNFVFPPREPTSVSSAFMNMGYMVELRIDQQGVRGLRLYPYRIDLPDGLVSLTGEAVEGFEAFLTALSEPLCHPRRIQELFDVAVDHFWEKHWRQRLAGLTEKMCAGDRDGLRHGRSHFRSPAHRHLIDRAIVRQLAGQFGQANEKLASQLKRWFEGDWPIRWGPSLHH